MLAKLIKWEFDATWRIMLAFFGGLLVLTLAACLFIGLVGNGAGSYALVIVGSFGAVAYFLAITAVGAVTVVLLVYRFYKSLLSDEGYLSFSLPVGVHAQLWSKLIVSAVWIVASFACIVLSILLVASRVGVAGDVLSGLSRLADNFAAAYGIGAGTFAALTATVLLSALLYALGLCLSFYAAMSLGFGFSEHKVLASILIFLGIYIVSSYIVGAVQMGVGIASFVNGGGHAHGMVRATSSSVSVHGTFISLSLRMALISCALNAARCAVLYCLTAWSLKKRLNLA